MDKVISRQVITDAMEMAGLAENVGSLVSQDDRGKDAVAFVLDGKRGAMRKVAKFAHALGTLAERQHEDVDSFATSVSDFDLDARTAYLLDALSMDDLGLDMIVYFPGWRLAD